MIKFIVTFCTDTWKTNVNLFFFFGIITNYSPLLLVDALLKINYFHTSQHIKTRLSSWVVQVAGTLSQAWMFGAGRSNSKKRVLLQVNISLTIYIDLNWLACMEYGVKSRESWRQWAGHWKANFRVTSTNSIGGNVILVIPSTYSLTLLRSAHQSKFSLVWKQTALLRSHQIKQSLLTPLRPYKSCVTNLTVHRRINIFACSFSLQVSLVFSA